MIKTIAVISALDIEHEYLKEAFDFERTERLGPYELNILSYEGKKIISCICGIGKVNSAIMTQRIIDKYAPDLVINTGVCGGLDKSLSYKDVIIADKLVYHDFESEWLEKYFPNTDAFYTDKDLIDNLVNIMKDDKISVRVGTIVTGDQFIESSQKQEELNKTYGALGVEMEGASIAHACFANDTKFLIIRSLSDFAGDDAGEDFDNNAQDQAHLSGRVVEELIKKL
ncbi:MAG: 5'-methylthioadenosine/adenosylhomocysteine nucleosidase [Finegoldia sp.]|nr:5'-methylthioadenosine/adenosylhomocysteine nucleosidase [Finegoldia sp.]